ncbi:MAG: ImmA/IrrE family metallo-endopeptidase [Deltaproteobacteria bacterium]|nr:ImmA/IrrE family metallo-endopeptidase [Deltaproteobacteria bacterium]
MKVDLPLPLLRAEKRAAEIIERFGITAPEHIRLEDIAYAMGAKIVEGPLKGAAASLVRLGDKATIRIPVNEKYKSRKRFSVAHELGHFVLSHGHSIFRVCTEDNIMDWNHNPGQETEANFFAGELLLPKKLFKDRCDVREVNFTAVRKLAQEFTTSLTATAIRFVRFCPEMCALVFSKDSKIQWFYKSEDWWPILKKGQPLDNGSFAYNFFHRKEVPDEPLEVDGKAWIDSRRVESIIEHSIVSKNYGYVLSLLWIKP